MSQQPARRHRRRPGGRSASSRCSSPSASARASPRPPLRPRRAGARPRRRRRRGRRPGQGSRRGPYQRHDPRSRALRQRVGRVEDAMASGRFAGRCSPARCRPRSRTSSTAAGVAPVPAWRRPARRLQLPGLGNPCKHIAAVLTSSPTARRRPVAFARLAGPHQGPAPRPPRGPTRRRPRPPRRGPAIGPRPKSPDRPSTSAWTGSSTPASSQLRLANPAPLFPTPSSSGSTTRRSRSGAGPSSTCSDPPTPPSPKPPAA